VKKATKKTARSRKAAKAVTKRTLVKKSALKPAQHKKRPPRPTDQAKGNGHARAGNTGQLRIRMYRVGFGDFFLMTVPSADGPQHVVVDCGVTRGKTGEGDIGTIKEAVADMVRETGGKLALIIMTHRHMDHIIGFSRCPEFKDFKGKIGAIWMPVWENEYDPEISKFQGEMLALAMDVRNYLATAADDMPDRPEMLAMLENATGVEMGMTGAGTGGGTNAASLDLLKHGLGVKPSYYCKGEKVELPQVLVDAGLAAEILGPPPVSAAEFMNFKDLRKGVGQYLDASPGGGVTSKLFHPFGKQWKVNPSGYPDSAFREWKPRTPEDSGDPKYVPWQHLTKAVHDAQPAALMTAAKQLDKNLNNQSLVVLFTFREKKLLFAGDAQAGNWEYWLYDGDKPTKTPSDKLGKDGATLLGNLDFYKVGHHGSTNATPIAAVNAMNNKGFVAMCSTQADSFGSVANKSEVPRIPLIDALKEKSTLVRSDQLAVKVDGELKVPPVKGTSPDLPKPRAGKLVPGPCYVDYLL
jgi:hypothetical protein